MGFVALARFLSTTDRPKFEYALPHAVLSFLALASLPYVAWTSSMHDDVAEHGARDMSPLVETLFRIRRAAELSGASIALPFELHPSYFFRGDETLVDGLPGLGLALVVMGLGVLGWKRKELRCWPLALRCWWPRIALLEPRVSATSGSRHVFVPAHVWRPVDAGRVGDRVWSED
ncbi:MAG: hypothetical protein R3E66_12465 [bacterium]